MREARLYKLATASNDLAIYCHISLIVSANHYHINNHTTYSHRSLAHSKAMHRPMSGLHHNKSAKEATHGGHHRLQQVSREGNALWRRLILAVRVGSRKVISKITLLSKPAGPFQHCKQILLVPQDHGHTLEAIN